MKKVVLPLILSFLIGTALFSQEITPNKVPVPVKRSFAKQFPGAKMVQYEQDNTDYIISFLEQDKQYIVTYNNSGEVIATDKEIEPAALPTEVSSSVKNNFPGYTIVTVVRREANDKGICFEMDLKKNDAGYSVRFSDKGEILQKIARRVEFKVATKTK
jgi:hypothetical protein